MAKNKSSVASKWFQSRKVKLFHLIKILPLTKQAHFESEKDSSGNYCGKRKKCYFMSKFYLFFSQCFLYCQRQCHYLRHFELVVCKCLHLDCPKILSLGKGLKLWEFLFLITIGIKQIAQRGSNRFYLAFAYFPFLISFCCMLRGKIS